MNLKYIEERIKYLQKRKKELQQESKIKKDAIEHNNQVIEEKIETDGNQYLYGTNKNRQLYNIVGPKCHYDKEKILIYGNVNTNIIDGSSVWLINIATLFARRYKVDILLKAIPQNDLLTSKLEKNNNINIISPNQFPKHLLHFNDTYYLKDYSASELIYRLDMENEYHFILCRGFDVSYYLASNPYLKNKLITYLLVQHGDLKIKEQKQKIDVMIKNSKIILLQTELAKKNILNHFDITETKILLLPPLIDDLEYPNEININKNKQERECLYAGKFDINWRIPDIIKTFIETGKKITFAGNKFHNQLVDGIKLKDYFLDTIEKKNNLTYLGAFSHNEMPDIIKKYDYGISVRTEEFLKSLEFSTKVLEFGYLSKPTIVNDSKINRLVLGEDYPLFANTNKEIIECLEKIEDNEIYQKAAQRCFEVAQKHTMTNISTQLFPNIEQVLRRDKKDYKKNKNYYITKIDIRTTNQYDSEKNTLLINDLDLYEQREIFIRIFKWSDIIIYHYNENSVTHILELAEKYYKKIIIISEKKIDTKITSSKQVIKSLATTEYQTLDSNSYHELLKTANNEIDISIIIPSKDTAKDLLYRAIDSIINQKYIEKYQYEIVIIDDGSEKKVSDIINNHYDKTYPIRVIRNEQNQGLGFSRNIGLEHARGEHIYYLDADDYYNYIYISSMEKKLENNKINLVICAMKTLHEDTNKMTTENHINVAIEHYLDPKYETKLQGSIRFVNSVVKGFRKKEMIENRYFHDRGYHEDIFPWIKYYFETQPVIEICKEANYIRTIRSGSNQITQNKDILKIRLQHLNKINQKILNLLNYLNDDLKFDPLIDFYNNRYISVKNQLQNLKE